MTDVVCRMEFWTRWPFHVWTVRPGTRRATRCFPLNYQAVTLMNPILVIIICIFAVKIPLSKVKGSFFSIILMSKSQLKSADVDVWRHLLHPALDSWAKSAQKNVVQLPARLNDINKKDSGVRWGLQSENSRCAIFRGQGKTSWK